MLGKCPDCKQDVSSTADVCPHCGNKVTDTQKSGLALLVAILFFLFGFLMFLGGRGSEQETGVLLMILIILIMK